MNPLAYRLLVMADSRRWIEVAVLNSRPAAVRKLRELRTEDARLQRRRNLHALRRWPADMQRLRGPIGEVYTPRRPMATRTLYTRMRAWVIRLARRFT